MTAAGHRAALLLWLAPLTLAIAFCAWQISRGGAFYSNVMHLLPQDERNTTAQQLSGVLAHRFEDRLLILIKDNPSAARYLNSAIATSPLLTPEPFSQTLPSALTNLYRPYSQQLLTSKTRQWLQEHSPEELAEQSWRALYNPAATPRPYPFAEDPFNLGGPWLAGLNQNTQVQQRNGLSVVADSNSLWYVVSARLTENPFQLAPQKAVTELVSALKAEFPATQVLTSGMVFHAAAGTDQARKEVSTVGVGSLLGIVLLALWVFASLRPLGFILLVLSAACVFALATSLAVFGRIHIITLAFGSTLLGVAVDYVLHFLIAARRQGSGLKARRHLARAMTVGALTTAAAYLLQLTTPFPGLKQMAVFSAAGLVGAWLSVLVLAPFYRPASAAERGHGIPLLLPLTIKLHHYLRRRQALALAVLAVFTLGAGVLIARGGVNDAVTNINTSPEPLLRAEQQVQALLQTPSASRYFALEAANATDLLNLQHQLNTLLGKHSGQNPARWVPTESQQMIDRALVEQKLYSEGGALAQLCARLQTRCEAPDNNLQVLTLNELLSSPAAALAMPVKTDVNGTVHTLVPLKSPPTQAVITKAESLPGVKFENQAENLTALLARYRHAVGLTLLATWVLLAVVVGVLYRQRAWRALTPMLLAMTTALAAASFNGLTLFHLMALLLVLGIGIDTSAFYLEVGLNEDSWLASTVSCATSILAFGLLSLSEVPVLHQFGIVILCGIFCCWWLAPFFYPPNWQHNARTP